MKVHRGVNIQWLSDDFSSLVGVSDRYLYKRFHELDPVRVDTSSDVTELDEGRTRLVGLFDDSGDGFVVGFEATVISTPLPLPRSRIPRRVGSSCGRKATRSLPLGLRLGSQGRLWLRLGLSSRLGLGTWLRLRLSSWLGLGTWLRLGLSSRLSLGLGLGSWLGLGLGLGSWLLCSWLGLGLGSWLGLGLASWCLSSWLGLGLSRWLLLWLDLSRRLGLRLRFGLGLGEIG